MLYDRRHTFEISEYGGLSTPMPKLAAFFLFVALSSLGLPMLNGFVGSIWYCSARTAALAMGYLGRAWRDSLRCYCCGRISGVLRRNHREKNRMLPTPPHARSDSRDHGGRNTVDGHRLDIYHRATAAASQDVIDQVEPQRPYEAAVPKKVVAPDVVTAGGATQDGVAPRAKRDSPSR